MTSLEIQAEAYAFRELVKHLQWRKDVQNIDLMNLAGFCRNCMSKWYHIGTQKYGMNIEHEEACVHVYGEPYSVWKKKNQTPATEEQMAKFKTSHSAGSMGRFETVQAPLGLGVGSGAVAGGGGHSSVCGTECDASSGPVASSTAGGVSGVEVRVAVLTASDRASAGVYEDLSGPAAAAAVQAFGAMSGALAATIVGIKVVPDDEEQIFNTMREWSASRECNLIITTGGTGFGARDVTPEATRRLITRPAEGLARAMAYQTSFVEPHSVLSRGICGITAEGVLVINTPGNPNAVKQCLAVVLPVLPQALNTLGAAHLPLASHL